MADIGKTDTLPHNWEHERTVLGAILLDPGALDTVNHYLSAKDFYEWQHQCIFRIIQDLCKQGIEPNSMTLVEELEKRPGGLLEKIGGIQYISGFDGAAHSSANVAYYAQVVQDCSIRRALMGQAKNIFDQAQQESQDVRGILERAREDLSSFQRLRPRKPLAEQLREKHKRDSERDPYSLLGYQLGTFGRIAQDIDGLQPGFYVIGAYTNVGKTHVLTNIWLDALYNNPELRGIYFSLDDSKEVIFNRLLALKTWYGYEETKKEGFTINQIQKKQIKEEDSRKIAEAYDHFVKWAEKGRIEILDQSDIQSITDLEQEIRLRAKAGPLIVAVDDAHNIPLPESGGMDRRGLNIEIANRLKALVDIHRIPLLITVEARKRSQGANPMKAPHIDDFMETGKWGYNATVAWVLHDTEEREGEQIGLDLSYVKNKLSPFKMKRGVWLTPDTGRMEVNDRPIV